MGQIGHAFKRSQFKNVKGQQDHRLKRSNVKMVVGKKKSWVNKVTIQKGHRSKRLKIKRSMVKKVMGQKGDGPRRS